MRVLVRTLIVAALACVGATAFGRGREIVATRTATPPVLDGKLDEACWREAKPVREFTIHANRGPAEYQSVAYVAYDRANIYIAVKCLDPNPEDIVAKPVPHDGGVFASDVVEVMLASSPKSGKYVHLAVNAAGSTFDTYRSAGGAEDEPRWDGQWQAKCRIVADGWIAEMAVPFATLDVREATTPTWGINICREKVKPRELSSIIRDGTFNSANRFAVLKGIRADFRRFRYRIKHDLVSFKLMDGKPFAVMQVSVANETGKEQPVKVDSIPLGFAATMTLPPNQSVALGSFPIELEEMIAGKPGKYLVAGKPEFKKVRVADARTGDLLAVASIVPPRVCTVLEIGFANPFSKERVSLKPASIDVEARMLLADEDSDKSALTVTLTGQNGTAVARREIQKPKQMTRLSFPTKDLAWGAYTIEAAYRRGETHVRESRSYALMPDGAARIKPLNNLVFELLNARDSGRLAAREFAFMNPRKGWVFFSLDAPDGAKLFLNGAKTPLCKGKGAGTASETMRLLSAGRHELRVEGADGALKQLVARAMPETIYSRLAFGPHTEEFGPYDWEFLSGEVLPNSTTILGHPRGQYTEGWAALGRGLVDEGAGRVNMPKGASHATDAYLAEWKKNAGLSRAGYSGVFLDEFGGGGFAAINPIAEAMRTVAADPKYRDRYLAPWCYFVPGKTGDFNHGSEASSLMAEIVFRAGWPVAYESYLVEAPATASEKGIDATLIEPVRHWNREFPDAVQRMVLCLIYTRQFNIDPGVDFKVHMDMQFQTIANNPEFFGLYGVMEYISSWADREPVRWAGMLYRHYCIEGNTERLSKDPYVLTHVRNPDFDDGLSEWDVLAAEPESVAAKTIPGYGNFQARRTKLFTAGWQARQFPAGWQSRGDHVLWTRRGAAGPNVFAQEIRNLQPGRLYSLTMLTGDYRDLVSNTSRKQRHVVSIRIENADPLPGAHNSFTSLRRNKVTKAFPKFTHSHPFWLNHRWRVFRARATTAKLIVSDWGSDEEPGAPVGQELIHNFVEVQPHLEEKPTQGQNRR